MRSKWFVVRAEKRNGSLETGSFTGRKVGERITRWGRYDKVKRVDGDITD